MLELDGIYSSSSSNAGVVLISPKGEPQPMVFKLEFGNMINMVEYKAFLLKIIDEKEKGIKILKAQGDVELFVRKIRGQYSVKNHKLKNYGNRAYMKSKG